jgi:hypothetical protein
MANGPVVGLYSASAPGTPYLSSANQSHTSLYEKRHNGN